MPNPNPKPLKRKKASSASRNTKGGNCTKRTDYEFTDTRTALSLPSTANAQQIAFSATSKTTDRMSAAACRSPLRRSTRYKTMLLEDEQEKNETMTKKVEESVQDLETKVKRFPLSKRN